MTVAENANSQRDWKKKESFGSAIMQIGIVAVILAATVFFIYQRGSRRKETAEHLKETRLRMLRDNPADLEKALSELELLFKLDASQADGLALAADIWTEKWLVHRLPGAEAKARDYLKQAEARGSKSEERFGTQALHMLADGKAKEADAFIDELRKKGASSGRLWFAIANAQRELGSLSVARQSYASAIDKSWKDPRFTCGFGEALLDEGNYLQALDVLTKATNANPEHMRARLNVALARVYRKDRIKDASDTVNELLGNEASLTPGLKARALSVKAELANFDESYDEAIKAAEEALALNPEEHYALFAKARALGLKKDPGATAAFDAAVAKRRTAPAIFFDGALLLQKMGDHPAAIALLDKYEKNMTGPMTTTSDGKQVPVIDRDDRYWLTRGEVLKQADKLDEAMAAYDKAVAASNLNLVRAHFARGALFLQRKDYDNAEKTLVNITPPDGSGTLGEAYEAMGDTKFAKKEFAEGCQHFAFALTRYRATQVPRERLNSLLEDVNKRLIAGGQREMAKLWMTEAKPLIQ